MVEPNTGLPHDRFDGSLFDIMPQFASIRNLPYTTTAPGATLESSRCTNTDCRHNGNYGLTLKFTMPPGTFGSYNVEAPRFNVSKGAYLEVWTKGAQGGERFELVLWSNCKGGFPGRPNSALITVSASWKKQQLPLKDFYPYADLSALCRLSIGFNDAIYPGGSISLDQIAFVDSSGNYIHVPLDETTNVTNIGLYMTSVIGALDLGLEDRSSAVSKLQKTLTSIEAFQKSHGFPHTHNHIVSLRPAITSSWDDRCRQAGSPIVAELNLFSTVDLGNLAAGLILVRQRIPELSTRAGALLQAMEWSWLFDSSAGLPYGCRATDGSPSSWWHYDWLAADSRLAHFIGIGTGKMPPGSWMNLNRSHQPPRCASLGNDLWHFEPGWAGGGLFMQLLPGIFLDEAGSELGTSARNFVQDQTCYAQQIGAPAWGWSATALPPYGAEYCGYGCVRDDILVPHATLLAAEIISGSELSQNLSNLHRLGARPLVMDMALDYGFIASANWQTDEVATTYLVLDQTMAFLSLVNYRTGGKIRASFCQDGITRQAMTLIPDYSNSCAN